MSAAAASPGAGRDHGLTRRLALARRRRTRRFWLGLSLASLAWSAWTAGLFDPEREHLNPRGLPQLWRAVRAIGHPELGADFLALVAHAAGTTLGYAVLGSGLTVVIGALGGLLASRTWWSVALPARGGDGPGALGTAAWLAVRAALVPPRALHEVLWGVLLIRAIGLDPLAAVLAIGLPYGAITAKVFSELVDEERPEPVSALRDAGARPLSAFVYGAVPRVLPELVSYAFYRLECSIRAAAVLGIFGAGGLGFQLQLSLRSLRYEEVWTIVGALIVLTGAVDVWSGRARRALALGVNPRFARGSFAGTEGVAGRHRQAPRGFRWHVLTAALAVPAAWLYVRPDLGELFDRGVRQRAVGLLQSAWPPSAGDDGLVGLLAASADTLAMSILAAGVAGALALALSVPAARNVFSPQGLVPRPGPSGRGAIRARLESAPSVLARTVLLVLRAVPAPLWALMILFVVRPGILPGALAIGLYTAGIVGRLTAEVIENVAADPPRALALAGAPRGAVLAYGVAPIALPRFLLYIVYRWEECVRATVAVGLVGAGGLGRALQEQLISFHNAAIGGTVLAFVCLALLADIISLRIRSAFRNA